MTTTTAQALPDGFDQDDLAVGLATELALHLDAASWLPVDMVKTDGRHIHALVRDRSGVPRAVTISVETVEWLPSIQVSG